jgi:hypothetical protein
MQEIVAEKIKRLLDFETIAFKYGLYLNETIDIFEAGEQAYEHGEAPSWHKSVNSLHKLQTENREKFINDLPVRLSAQIPALADLMIENNRNLIDLMLTLTGQDATDTI